VEDSLDHWCDRFDVRRRLHLPPESVIMARGGGMNAQGTRSRIAYALSAVVVVAVGPIWRSHLLPLSPFLRKYGGDALWAVLVFGKRPPERLLTRCGMASDPGA
jgi:hypothetical protein